MKKNWVFLFLFFLSYNVLADDSCRTVNLNFKNVNTKKNSRFKIAAVKVMAKKRNGTTI